jgi:ATP-dependent protease ClpP protease subunit
MLQGETMAPDSKIKQAVDAGSTLVTQVGVNDYVTEVGRLKIVAQTEEIRANIAKTEAERQSVLDMNARAEADHVQQMAAQGYALDFARLNKTVAEISTRREERAEKIAMTGNRFNHFYAYNEPVTARSVTECIDQLIEWQRLAPVDANGKVEPMTVTIVFDSPGGSVIDGLHLYDFLQELKGQGHIVITKTLGMAASMAGILLQAGSRRVMGSEAYVLIHEVSFMAGGPIGVVEDEVEFVKMIQSRVLDIFARKAARALEGVKGPKETEAAYQKRLDDRFDERRDFFEHGKRIESKVNVKATSVRKASTRTQVTREGGWSRKDWWLNSDQALEAGFVDEVQPSVD